MEALQHELERVFPTVETQTTGQGPNIVEQAFAERQLLAKKTVLVVHPRQYRVGEVCQEDESRYCPANDDPDLVHEPGQLGDVIVYTPSH
jgi:hypothetical protein